MKIEELVAACMAQIETSHSAREQALSASRALIRQCANTIRAAHRGEFDEAERLLGEAAVFVAQIDSATAGKPDIRFAGYSQDALKEFVEAHVVLAFLAGREAPSAASLGVEGPAYLNGLAEAASELRRAILDGLRRGEVERGEALLQIMDEVYSALITVDYPEAVTGGLRRTTDALRAVLERTRGDMTAALRQDQLTTAMRELEQRLSSLS
ncbi:haloacid dehalogenase [Candidatus Viridilinea mediisalina]|uniref:Haloacid dehalogenase n=1 Tax=Candidatus Viridilinea mediisalina TaxID=2024553 RepID=A0A2A6RD90_9CHLR|nr:haloacid dehalogenase [Candidatus Viridilinea mediisalina]PDV99360.1 haloacid dehalogenase [Candidatus Viridilinea mediisalina]